MPLHWSQNCEERSFCLRFAPESGDMADPIWSAPIVADLTSLGIQHHVPIPVRPEEPPLGSAGPQDPSLGDLTSGAAVGDVGYLRKVTTVLKTVPPEWARQGQYGRRVEGRMKHRAR